MNKSKLIEITNKELASGEWVPIKEAATRNGVTIPTIRNYIDRGLMQAKMWYGKMIVKMDKK